MRGCDCSFWVAFTKETKGQETKVTILNFFFLQILRSVGMHLWSAQCTSLPFLHPPSPQLARCISFSPFPSEVASLVGLLHGLLLFSPSPQYFPGHIADVNAKSHSDLWCLQTSPSGQGQLWWAGLQAQPRPAAPKAEILCLKSYSTAAARSFCPCSQGFQQAHKCLNRKVFLCCFWVYLLSVSLEVLQEYSPVGIIHHLCSHPDCNL